MGSSDCCCCAFEPDSSDRMSYQENVILRGHFEQGSCDKLSF